jgi:hypothetical protein
MPYEVFETRVKIQQIIENQLPEFILEESPKAAEFLKQYYISQEFQGGVINIADNLDQYIKLDNLTPEVIVGSTTLSQDISSDSDVIIVNSTKGFPAEYGLLKIDDEIITYTGVTTDRFTGCIRGFSGITDYRQPDNPNELIFRTSESASHKSGSNIINLSSLFLKEFYKKIKYTFTPGLEDIDFVTELNVNNFIKEARTLYQTKGTSESFRILFKVLYNEEPKVIDLEQFLIKPSSAEFIRREVIITEKISGNPINLIGQTIRRSRDESSQASVSEVELLSRKNKEYYRISLFVGYNDKDSIDGQFLITGKTKVLEDYFAGDSVITVDSTIGFDKSGVLIAETEDNVNTIYYTDKTVNQFLGCTGIESKIPLGNDIYSYETIYGYENGDLSKKVELKITGVLSDFIPIDDSPLVSDTDKIYYKSLGEYIENNEEDPSYKQIFSNSWIYNTSCRYELENFTEETNVLQLKTESDRSSLDVGDYIDIIDRSSNLLKNTVPLQITTISSNKKTITVEPGFSPEEFTGYPGKYKDYDIRRRIKKSSSAIVPLEYGNNVIISNIQNLYVDEKSYAYLASNGLPEYPITVGITTAFSLSPVNLENYDLESQSYSAVKFVSGEMPFLTGDVVIYQSEDENNPIIGLEPGSKYYVEVISFDSIRLYLSRSSIQNQNFIKLRKPNNGFGVHTFVLRKDVSNLIKVQKNLKKFPLFQDLKKGSLQNNDPGPIGMLINGTEIISPKSLDKIYYGPIKKINILSSGENYDVINPPKIEINQPSGGTRALVQPVLRGTIQSVTVDPQNFDIDTQIYVNISGGNGSGTVLEPIISKRYRELEFNARVVTNGGSVDINNEAIVFFNDHNLSSGERLIYDSGTSNPIGIGTYLGDNGITGQTLISNSNYYISVVNSKTIRLHNSLSDATAGINTVGFTTENTNGFHKFRTAEKYTLSDIKVINPGSEYENKKLYVKSSAISTSDHSIHFKNHNFGDGDLVIYSYSYESGTPISGLSTTTYYKVLKLDDDNFRLSNAGVSGNDNTNYMRREHVEFASTGSGFQIIEYPPITVTVTGLFSSGNKKITATPVVRGKIVDTYLYEPGSGYGSTIVNFEKKPIIKISSGKDAELFAVIRNGRIIDVNVAFGGYEYYSTPDLVVQGVGSGAVLRAVIENGRISDVVVIKSGIGYDANTKIAVKTTGKNASFDIKIRDLSIDDRHRYGKDEILINYDDYLKYGLVSYSTNIGRTYLRDVGSGNYSPIIGWAYDGNPIYGPYAPSDPNNVNSEITNIKSGYIFDPDNVFDRPNVPGNVRFIEDYVFNNSGDLDEHNGRFAKTLEFPNGVYAYYATIDNITLEPKYPYFIGKTYRSSLIEENFLPSQNQDYNFNESGLLRNTFPYGLNQPNVDNEFIFETGELSKQLSNVESVSSGFIESLDIISSGDNYKVGEKLVFDDSDTGGGGVESKITEVVGDEIVSIASSILSYDNSTLIWNKNNVTIRTTSPHELTSGEFVSISGISTYLKNISDFYKISFIPENMYLTVGIPTGSPGIVTDIYVSYIPGSVSSDTTILIGNEEMKVLNIFQEDSVIRVKRDSNGDDYYPDKTQINILPQSFNVPIKTDYFKSDLNEKVYFNPKISVGIGTESGIGISTSFLVGTTEKSVDIQTQSIYLPGHKFVTGQKVTFTRGSSAISVANTQSSTPFTLPFNPLNDSQEVYIINKSKDYIGITTTVGLTTNTNGLFFVNNGANDYEYSFETENQQVRCNINRIKAVVSVSTDHNLSFDDVVKLNVVSKSSTGVGSSDKIRISFNNQYNKILVNPIGFTSSSVLKNSDTIQLPSHGFKTGDKVFYETTSGEVSTGLSTGSYYIYKIDNNKIQLGKTLYDVLLPYPNIVGISSEGGNDHRLSLINPQILVTRDSNLVFDVSDSSLDDYNFNIFYDKNFYNNFVSTSNQSEFDVVSIGSSIIVNYSDNLPQELYYNLTKNGEIVQSDLGVSNHNQILYVDSVYNGYYNIIGVGQTTFSVCLQKLPEVEEYTPNNSIIEYTTKSADIRGPIGKVNLISGGYNYKKLPEFIKVNSEFGVGANIIPKSNNIGKINKVRILEQTFDYPSDKTLNPSVEVSPTVILKNSNTISNVSIKNGGKNYISPPKLIICDANTMEVVDNDSLLCEISSGSISSVIFNKNPYGLKDSPHKVIATNNSNGIGVDQVNKITNTIFDLILTTPISGYSSNLFVENDLVFIEGIKIVEGSGSGLNSSDYGYSFFKVESFSNTVPAVVRINLEEFTSNIGLIDVSDTFAYIVGKNNYPEFEVTQVKSQFTEGEKLLVKNSEGTKYDEKDLFVLESNIGFIKIFGKYSPKINDVIFGKNSGVIAAIDDIIYNKGKYQINYSNKVNRGWTNDIGKLSESYQVCPDNDYYQNLSYTVKSTIEFSEMINPVNRLLHSAGLKNFADTEVISSAKVGVGSTSIDVTILDVIGEHRVDTINNFDLGVDVDTKGITSKYIKVKNKKFSDYFKCLSNRVLMIDDVSSSFNDDETNKGLIAQQFTDIGILNSIYSRYLIQINNITTDDIELSEIIVMRKNEEIFIFEKGSISNTKDKFGTFTGAKNEQQNIIRFIPDNIYDYDYDIKILNTNFNSTIFANSLVPVGFVDLVGYKNIVAVGKTYNVAYFNKDEYDAFFAQVHIYNPSENTNTYAEIFASHDGSNVSFAEYYFDDNDGPSQNFIGVFEPNISIYDNEFRLDFYNDENNSVDISAKVIGFGSTSVGIGTYRFKSSDQLSGDERTAVLQSNYNSASSAVDVLSINKNDFSSIKSFVKVSYGQTSALHQVMLVHNNVDSYVVEYPYVSVGSTTGIGTFGSSMVGSNVILKFFVDSNILDSVDVQSYSEIFYKDSDFTNIPENLLYNPIQERFSIEQFNALNGSRINKFAFDMKYRNVPIFVKKFDPKDILDLGTGIFSIRNHFFSTGEKVFYTPNTTTGSLSPIKINPTYNLPSEVYVHSIDPNNFGISTTKSDALAGIYVTFTSFGSGNAHEFEMEKKIEKCIISIDGVVQQPLTYTPISYSLSENGGNVSASTTYFSISGISTIRNGDFVKIENEYMKILSVGLGTTSVGPITESGEYQLLNVERGFFNSTADSYSDGDPFEIYRGSYNIVNNQIYFSSPPRGGGREASNDSNLPFPEASFSGRVYLQQDYAINKIYDDISYQFTGIGRTFTLKSGGQDISGIGTGNGFVFINDIFQTPTTSNNSDNDFEIISSGISTVIFSGITTTIGTPPIVVDYDTNQNELPKGGIVVSLGSTSGLGFAPLVGASVTAVVSSGSIVSVGLGSTDFHGSGYNRQVSVAVTDTTHTGTAASITASIGIGGTLIFNVISGGSGYNNPSVVVSEPSYENLSVIGVFRPGIGSTTITGSNLKLDIAVGASSTIGIGSGLYEVKYFTISNSGYGFRRGDIIKPVGLVTDKSLASPIIECELTVTDVFDDSFYGLQLGEFDYIDTIKSLQDGSRTRFPLQYNGEERSIEIDPTDPVSSAIDLDATLLIFVNGVIQEPNESYQFDGGASFTFAVPPKPEDEVSIFFYQGKRGVDVIEEDIIESVKVGDNIQLFKNDLYRDTVSQEKRLVESFKSSDQIVTNVYVGQDVNNSIYKPLSWTKQKIDKVISGQNTYKSRKSLEPLIFPTSNIIGSISKNDSKIFVDSIELFRIDNPEELSGIILPNTDSQIESASFTAIVNEVGQVSTVNITNPGFGYTESTLDLIFSPPSIRGIGIGTTSARGTVTFTNGSADTVAISSGGSGYSSEFPPQVIVQSPPNLDYELLSGISSIKGFSGSIIGINTVSVGSSHKIIFDLLVEDEYDTWTSTLQSGYRIFVSETSIGSPRSSLNINDLSVVGVGSTFLDNIYVIHSISAIGIKTAAITSYINSSIPGITTYTLNGVGKFSWGVLEGVNRSTNPIELSVDGFTITSGLSTFPSIQRRLSGLRNTGAVAFART